MKRYSISLSRFLFLLVITSRTVAQGQTDSPFPEGAKRIVFLGNSITYAGSYITSIESYFLAHYPEKQFEFINVGLPSETVSGLSELNHADGRFPRPDLHERLSRVLEQTRPDVVFACYGMNDGIYLPLEETRFRAFREGMKWLHTELEKTGTKRIVFLTPPVHDDNLLGTQGYNRTLDTYSEWLVAQRDSLKWDVADIHFSMTNYLIERRITDPSYKLAADGVHPGDAGHWLMAKSILQFLGEPVTDAPDLQSTLPTSFPGDTLVSLVSQRQQIMKDAWLTSTGHKRPEMQQGIPMNEARQHYDELEKRIRAILTENKGMPTKQK